MSFLVRTSSRQLTIKRGEEESEKLFDEVLELLLKRGKKVITKVEFAPVQQEEEYLAVEDTAKRINEIAAGNEKGTEQAEQVGYKGFLLVKCKSCGKIRAFCSKSLITSSKCDCGEVTQLEDMRLVYMNCECGQRSKYMTNIKERQYDVTCISCKQPVAVTWNEKKKAYQTINNMC